jgi:hypothetical protein
MMLKVLPLTALALGLSSGAAFADRGGDHRGGDHRATAAVAVRDHGGRSNVVVQDRGRGNAFVRDHRDVRYGGGGRVVVRNESRFYGGGRVVVRNEPRFRGGYRRPIFVSRPIIRERYYNYYRRPSLIVESYNTPAGYYWVAGGWTWNGYEWIWQPGHYQPDPNYVDGYDGY